MNNLTRIVRERTVRLTELDYQDAIQAPVPKTPEKLTRAKVGIADYKVGIITHTSGAVLRRIS